MYGSTVKDHPTQWIESYHLSKNIPIKDSSLLQYISQVDVSIQEVRVQSYSLLTVNTINIFVRN